MQKIFTFTTKLKVNMRKTPLYLAVAALITISCNDHKEQYLTIEGAMLGTTLRIVADAPCNPSELYEATMELDTKFKAEMSLFDSDSHLSRINRSQSDSLTPAIAYNLTLSDSISRISGGAYDVTVAPLVKALGFGAKEDSEIKPNIDSILEFVGYEKIRVEGLRLIRQDPRTQIDLNSIAKGYIVDQVAQLVESFGAQNYMVDIGGEISCRGVNSKGKGWRIGIETPFEGNMSNGEYLQKIISMPPDSPMRAMATSGNYRRYHLDDQGNKVAHTIDPKTGRSVLSQLLSVTVIAPTCALADAYGTMFMAVGSERAIELAAQITDAYVYFIFASESEGQEYREWYSAPMGQRLSSVQ